MIYLFDANSLIRSARHDFPFDAFLSFWNWLLQIAEETGSPVKIPERICNEMTGRDDSLSQWITTNRGLLERPDKLAYPFWGQVLFAYGNPEETELEKIENDSLLIAHALSLQGHGSVVTYEVPRNATAPRNKKIPTVCGNLGLRCISLPSFLWEKLGP